MTQFLLACHYRSSFKLFHTIWTFIYLYSYTHCLHWVSAYATYGCEACRNSLFSYSALFTTSINYFMITDLYFGSADVSVALLYIAIFKIQSMVVPAYKIVLQVENSNIILDHIFCIINNCSAFVACLSTVLCGHWVVLYRSLLLFPPFRFVEFLLCNGHCAVRERQTTFECRSVGLSVCLSRQSTAAAAAGGFAAEVRRGQQISIDSCWCCTTVDTRAA